MKMIAYKCDGCDKLAVTEDGSELAWGRVSAVIAVQPIGARPVPPAMPPWDVDLCPACLKHALSQTDSPQGWLRPVPTRSKT